MKGPEFDRSLLTPDDEPPKQYSLTWLVWLLLFAGAIGWVVTIFYQLSVR